MSNQLSISGNDGLCNFCRKQCNLNGSLGAGPRGGVFIPNTGADGPAIRLCTSCATSDALATLFAGAILDLGLDPATAASGLAAAVDAALGL